jgi:hypothetical protein
VDVPPEKRMRWPLAKSTLTRLLSRLSGSDDLADRQFADALEEAIVLAEKVELMKEINRDLRDRLSDLEAAAGPESLAMVGVAWRSGD